MLRLRICPSCQEETYSQKAYFCHRCGAELPPPSEITGTAQVEVKPEVKRERKERRAPAMVVAAALCAALFSVVAVGVYYFYSQNQVSLTSQPQAPKNETFVANVNFEIPNHPFSAKGLSEIVPSDVDLYLESVDPEVLLPSLISEDQWLGIETVFLERIGLSAVEATSFLEDEFAFIQESTSSAFLVRARDVDFLEQKLAETEEHGGWEARMVGGFLVMADSSELVRAIEEAQKKLTLNLSLTSGFVEARKGLPKSGQIFVYGEKRLDFIPDSVAGGAFVISKKDNGILVTGL